MKGRILSIKKTTLLRLSFIVNFIFYITTLILSLTVFNTKNLWFFSFCIFVGVVLITKSMLFRTDSSCYFGTLLFCIGIFYLYAVYFDIMHFYSVFVIASFSIASFMTFSFFKEQFQLLLCISLFFASITTIIFLLKFISIYIFLAFIFANVLLLICSYLYSK